LNSSPYILLTGATGGLGRNLTNFLLKKNYVVVALGRNKEVGKLLQESGAKFFPFDVCDKIQLPNNLGNCKGIIHAAAYSNPWGMYERFYKTNVLGTENIVDFALKKDCPLIHISTPSIYFDFKDKINIKEDAELPQKFASYYTHTKMQAENIVQAAHGKGLRAAILRPRGIFGPYDTAVFPRILKIASRGYFPLIREGEALVDITFVGNLVLAIHDTLKNLESRQEKIDIFNISNDQPLKIRDILFMLFESLNMKIKFYNMPYYLLKGIASVNENISKCTRYSFEPSITKYSLGLLSFSQTLNIDNAKEKLNYTPKYSIEDGMRQYSNWYSNIV
jgi:nucleoside-diphosphate-sugar epimerase